MTKTVISLYITVYSLLRLFCIVTLYYYDKMNLPTDVVAVTAITSVIALAVTLICYLKNLGGKILRYVLFMNACAVIMNFANVLIKQPGTLSNVDLIITGTFFDVVIFLASLTFKIRNTRYRKERSVFSRYTAIREEKNNGGKEKK